jgi:hypothetical protein
VQWNDVLDPTRNQVTAGSVYPSTGGSIAAGSTGGSVTRQITGMGGGAAQAAPMPAGSLVGGLLILGVLIAIVMFVVHKWGGASEDFSNVRASAYNIFIIALISIVGIPVIKIAAYNLAQAGVPGAGSLSTWTMAA